MRGLLRLLRLAFFATAIGLVGLAGLWLYYGHDLPDVEALSDFKRRPQVIVLDSTGARLATYGDLYGNPVKISDLPPHVPRAFLAVEDRRFYDHLGLDPIGLARAAIVNVLSGRVRQGGSTITQQLAKFAFLTPERSFGRKMREMILALRIERRYSKDEILAIYMNRVYLGARAYGIDAAARRYFGKPASRLNLYQAAMLAGLPRAPTRYSPMTSRERAMERTETVLAAMIDAGYITPRIAEQARRDKGLIMGPPPEAEQRYFTDWIVDLIPNYATLQPGQDDVIVRTTLSPSLQELAETTAIFYTDKFGAARRASQLAMVVMAPDGAVRALVGGARYRESQYNRAVTARRQPGSAFKVFVLLAALEAGIEPQDRVRDAPITLKGWTPRNFDGRYHGEVTLADTFAHSHNAATVRLAEQVGRGRVAEMAERLGIKSPLTREPSLPLGVSEVSLLELTGAYAVLANKGRAAQPYAILDIRTRKGTVIFQRQTRPPARLLSEAVVRDAQAVLAGVLTRGTARRAGFARPGQGFGKTGTTQEHRDAWFVGAAGDLVAGVWFGNDDRAPMKDVTGGKLPAQMWSAFMNEALRDRAGAE
jgi:penicillin-binding protein 1A